MFRFMGFFYLFFLIFGLLLEKKKTVTIKDEPDTKGKSAQLPQRIHRKQFCMTCFLGIALFIYNMYRCVNSLPFMNSSHRIIIF